MRLLIASALCLSLASACAHAPAQESSSAPTPVAPPLAPGAETASELPFLEPPATPMPGRSQVRIADALLHQNKPEEALVLYTQAWSAGNRDGDAAYAAACATGRSGRKAETLAWLSKAAEAGYRDVEWMKKDDDLASLRAEPEFTALLERIAKMPEPFPGSNAELQRLYAEDQQARTHLVMKPTKEQLAEFMAKDRERLTRVKEMVAHGDLKTGADFFSAGIIFQHGGTLEDYAMARDMGAEAARRGHPKGLWMAAAAWDRWLMRAGKPQRFGTQYVPAQGTPQMVLYTMDPRVTDEERARWGFSPLKDIPQARTFP
ncbi:hypothetical protein DRW03_00280 [Corallococcus sp. H22C18031201]|nr:hypothetical protein DRW03_00280 [Corallococcus sp. H22C18031201]